MVEATTSLTQGGVAGTDGLVQFEILVVQLLYSSYLICIGVEVVPESVPIQMQVVLAKFFVDAAVLEG
jgi:hypothetical protein